MTYLLTRVTRSLTDICSLCFGKTDKNIAPELTIGCLEKALCYDLFQYLTITGDAYRFDLQTR